jgi:hypothetical protein
MNILDEWWKRLLISFFLGGIFSEGLRLLSMSKVEISGLVLAIILYFVLTNIYNKSQNKMEKDQEK